LREPGLRNLTNHGQKQRDPRLSISVI
jgi:hypothetical protein